MKLLRFATNTSEDTAPAPVANRDASSRYGVGDMYLYGGEEVGAIVGWAQADREPLEAYEREVDAELRLRAIEALGKADPVAELEERLRSLERQIVDSKLPQVRPVLRPVSRFRRALVGFFRRAANPNPTDSSTSVRDLEQAALDIRLRLAAAKNHPAEVEAWVQVRKAWILSHVELERQIAALAARQQRKSESQNTVSQGDHHETRTIA